MIRSMHQMLMTFATALLTVVSVAQAFGPGCAPHLRPIQHRGRFQSIRFSATPITRLRGSAAPVKYGELQHCGVLVDDVETAVKFYTEVLGMQDVSETRPTKLDYPGAFLQAGCNQVHLMKLPSMDPREGRPEHGGRDRHVALTINNIDTIASRLTENGVKYTMSRSGRRALFCRDPYMNAIEFVEDTSIG